MKTCAMMSFVLLAAVAVAAPGKSDPVAEGYPDWQGAIDKNYIAGRHICNSDLRHKVTVVIELDADKAHGGFVKTGDIVALNGLAGFHAGENWETKTMPRDVLVVYSIAGGKDPEPVLNALKVPKGTTDETVTRALANVKHPSVPIYFGITFEGAPDSNGKRPFVYVMGPTGKEPVLSGELNAKTLKAVPAAVKKETGKLNAAGTTWAPFFGSVAEPKFYPKFAAEVAKGKPLTAFSKALLKDVVAKDAEKATEAQILYDAINQTRSDLALRVRLEARECPHRAVYDFQVLSKYWPAEKKRLADVMAAMKAMPEANQLATMFVKMMAWADPKFVPKNAGQVKTITAELNKNKKILEKLKESKNITVQNGALTIDGMIDELISTLPTRVPEK